MTLSRSDLNALIDDIIKVHPDATDTSKLQGKRHRELLKALADYVDNAAAAAAVAGGNFPFDWTVPSNAFNNYSNNEITFSPGMWKFLHRDMGPTAALAAANPRRAKGSSGDVSLSWNIAVGSAPLNTLTVAGKTIAPPTVTGTLNLTTPLNVDKSFSLQTSDATGQTASASVDIQFRSRGFVITSALDLSTATSAAITAEILSKGSLGLLDNRNMDTTVNPDLERIYVAFPASMDPTSGSAVVTVNTLVDNSFTKKAFTYGEYAGYTEAYVLYQGSNILKGGYTVSVR